MTRNVSKYFRNKIVVITGGGSGIGRALAQYLAEYGSTVVVTDRDMAAAQETCRLLSGSGYEAYSYMLDVRDRPAFAALAQSINDRFGRIDLLFNNAGIAIGGPAYEYSANDWDDIIDVNLKGTIHGIDAVYPLMRQQGFGQIVNTASVAAFFPNVLTVSYSATKAAINVLTMTLRIEAQAFGVKVNALCPGPVTTPILSGGKFGRRGHGISEKMMKRYWQKMKPMPVDEFAKQALAAVAQNKAAIILPRWWSLAIWGYRLSPALWSNYSNRAMLKFSRARAKLNATTTTL